MCFGVFFMNFLDAFFSFIQKYYILPVISDSGYNIFNTLTWAVILAVCVYGIIYSFNKMNICVNKKFFYSLLPFILSGSALRVVADAHVISPPWVYFLITPNIYFLMFFVTVFFLMFSVFLTKSRIISDFYSFFFIEGLVCLLFLIAVLFFYCKPVNIWVPFVVFIGGLLWTFLFYGFVHLLKKPSYINVFNASVVFSHMADATSTIVGINFFGYHEKHVVPAYLIDIAQTPLVMYPLKLVTVVLVLWGIDFALSRADDNKTLSCNDLIRNSLKIVIIILGLAPAVRNTLRIFFGV